MKKMSEFKKHVEFLSRKLKDCDKKREAKPT